MKLVRILFVNHRGPGHPQAGGAEEVILNISKRLVDRGIDVSWLSEHIDSLPDYDEVEGIKVLRRGSKASLHLHSLLEARKYDAIIDSVAHAVPFFSNLTNRRTVALVHHVHQEVLPLELGRVKSAPIRLLERGLRFYNRFIAVSETTKRDMNRFFGIPPNRVSVIRNGVDHNKYRPGLKDGEPFILWIGRLKKYKNPLDAIKIARKAKVRLIVVGTGEMEEEVRKESEGLVEYMGWVSEEEKVELYQRAWVVLNTSFVEGLGMTVIEAASCGTSAVAYDRGALPEVVKDGKTGFVVPYKNLERATDAVRRVIRDPEPLWKSAHEWSLEFDWDRAVEGYVEVIKSLFP